MKQNFNPRSPHGERRPPPPLETDTQAISTHAPRTGSDRAVIPSSAIAGTFQPTLPARGATSVHLTEIRFPEISTHAPRTGSDTSAARPSAPTASFQPTLPARGATFFRFLFHRHRTISTHAPRTGSDRCPMIQTTVVAHFNPRSPHGERPRKVTILSTRIIGFAQKVYHKTVLLRISLAENAVILPEKPRNPVRTSLQKAGGLRFARAIRAAHPYSISSPSGA